MPTYQYACTECDQAFEQFQNFSDDALTVCPQCQGRLRKVFNAVGVVFKGSGFYRNDSRTDGKSSKSAAPAAAKSDGASGSGSDSSSGSSSSSESSSSSSTEKKSESTSTKKSDSSSTSAA